MAAAAPDVTQVVIDGNLRLLKRMATEVDLRVVKDDKGMNLLHFAAKNGHLEICKFLIEEWGFDVNSLDLEGDTPVHMAALSGNVPVLQYLLDRGGDTAMANDRGLVPLHVTALKGHSQATLLLLSKGVPVDPMGFLGTPLDMAVTMHQDKTAKILLEHGADPNRAPHHGLSPLVMACQLRSLKCIKILVEAGANVNFKSSLGPSALMVAVDGGWTALVKYLLKIGADPNISDHFGNTPIMSAASDGDREIVEILFPHTKRIPSLPDWSVDGIIESMKDKSLDAQDELSVQERVADAKSQGKKAFTKGDYNAAIHFYSLAIEEDPHDATLFSNRSLCRLWINDGALALEDAQQCKLLRPDWPKAWYREGAALRLLKNYKGAADAFLEALKLDPESEETEKALRETMELFKLAVKKKKA